MYTTNSDKRNKINERLIRSERVSVYLLQSAISKIIEKRPINTVYSSKTGARITEINIEPKWGGEHEQMRRGKERRENWTKRNRSINQEYIPFKFLMRCRTELNSLPEPGRCW